MLQKTFCTWLPTTIRTTMTTTAIRTRMRAYSTMPCPSSRVRARRSRRSGAVSVMVASIDENADGGARRLAHLEVLQACYGWHVSSVDGPPTQRPRQGGNADRDIRHCAGRL